MPPPQLPDSWHPAHRKMKQRRKKEEKEEEENKIENIRKRKRWKKVECQVGW